MLVHWGLSQDSRSEVSGCGCQIRAQALTCLNSMLLRKVLPGIPAFSKSEELNFCICLCMNRFLQSFCEMFASLSNLGLKFLPSSFMGTRTIYLPLPPCGGPCSPAVGQWVVHPQLLSYWSLSPWFPMLEECDIRNDLQSSMQPALIALFFQLYHSICVKYQE